MGGRERDPDFGGGGGREATTPTCQNFVTFNRKIVLKRKSTYTTWIFLIFLPAIFPLKVSPKSHNYA